MSNRVTNTRSSCGPSRHAPFGVSLAATASSICAVHHNVLLLELYQRLLRYQSSDGVQDYANCPRGVVTVLKDVTFGWSRISDHNCRTSVNCRENLAGFYRR